MHQDEFLQVDLNDLSHVHADIQGLAKDNDGNTIADVTVQLLNGT